MPHYFNPPSKLPEICRLLEYTGSYEELISQLKPDEHLFAFCSREQFPQAAYIWSASHMSEYRSAQHPDQYYAMPKDEWDKHFSYMPKRYEQQRPKKKTNKQMLSKDDLFYPEGQTE
jgi:hypothetical protein